MKNKINPLSFVIPSEFMTWVSDTDTDNLIHTVDLKK